MPELIFNPQAGRVRSIVTNDSSVPAMLTFPGLDYTSYSVILTAMMLTTNPKFQATEVLGGDVHLVSFGESIGPVSVSGMLFEQTCESQAPDGNGVGRLLAWWTQQNVTRRTTPISLTIGTSTVVRAFLGSMGLSITEPQDRIWRFQLALMRIPERRELDEARFAAVPDPEVPEDAAPEVAPAPAAAMSILTGIPVGDAGLINPDGSVNGVFPVATTPTGYDDPSLGLSSPLL